MLNINPVNFISKINNNSQVRQHRTNALTQDVFVKTSKNVSFQGSTNSSFIDWAQQTDFIQKQLPEILSNPENKLGSGFSHSAFTIPDCEDYILRIPNYTLKDNFDFSKAELKDTEDKNLTINIGQEIAEIKAKGQYGIPNTIQVLRKQTGKSIGVPPPETIYIEDTDRLREGQLPYEARERKEYYAATVHQVSQLPQSAYEKLIDNIIIASEAGYAFDHLNSNNLLVDDDSINIIDMDKHSQKVNLGNILYALTNINYCATYASRYDSSPMNSDNINQVMGDTIQIINKFTNAMQAKGLKFNKNECSMEFFKLIDSIPFSFFCKTGDYNAKWAALEKMGLA